jgi:AraC-like DNA-binding protein
MRPITGSVYATRDNISERSLFILFNKHLGVPPLGYIAARKIEQAEKLLGSSWLSCGDIAQQLGFSSTNYFVRFVKKHTGLTPLQMRKRAEIRG